MVEQSAAIKYIQEHPEITYEGDMDTAIMEIYRGHPTTALFLLQRALEQETGNLLVMKWTGICYEKLNDRVLAAKYYYKALHLTEGNDLFDSFTQEITERLKHLGF